MNNLFALWIRNSLDPWVRNFLDPWMNNFLDSWLRNFLDSWLSYFSDLWLRNLFWSSNKELFLALWLKNFLDLWLKNRFRSLSDKFLRNLFVSIEYCDCMLEMWQYIRFVNSMLQVFNKIEFIFCLQFFRFYFLMIFSDICLSGSSAIQLVTLEQHYKT